MWRFHDRLPITDARHAVSLGEGDTPLLSVDLGLAGVAVSVKAEHLNPTGSFKDRLASVALSLVQERGWRGVLGTSSGNGGAAAAAYAARAKRTAVLLALADAPTPKLDQIRAVGGMLRPTKGLGHDAAITRAIAENIARNAPAYEMLPFLTGGRYGAEVMYGARTIAYELAEQAPHATHLYVPIGGGGLFASIWRGYRDLGLRPPQMLAVQPGGCATIRDALNGGPGVLPSPSTTTISGLQVAMLFDDDVLDALKDSDGRLIEVTDAEVHEAQRLLARFGIVVEPAGACALAGALADSAAGRLHPGNHAVFIATGAGWKDPNSVHALAATSPALPHDLRPLIEAIVS